VSTVCPDTDVLPVEQRGRLLDPLVAEVDAFASKLAKYYAAVSWHWTEWRGPGQEFHYVPDALHIRETLLRLIEDSRTNESGACSTGGLEVYVTSSGAQMVFSDARHVDSEDDPLEVYGA
jgi:hypothetical protein